MTISEKIARARSVSRIWSGYKRVFGSKNDSDIVLALCDEAETLLKKSLEMEAVIHGYVKRDEEIKKIIARMNDDVQTINLDGADLNEIEGYHLPDAGKVIP